MKIRTNILVNIIVFITFSLALASVILLVNYPAEMEQQKRHTAMNELVESVSDLEILTYEYLLHYESWAKSQWQAKHESTMRIVTGTELVEVGGGNQENILQKIKSANVILGRLSAIHQKYLENRQTYTSIDIDLKERLTSNLLMMFREIIHSSLNLERGSQKKLATIRKSLFGLIATLGVVLIAFVMGNFWWIIRKVIRPIEDLQKATEIVSTGNLNHKISITGENEIGRLAALFNQMTVGLKKVTVSRDALEQEVTERKNAEAKVMLRQQQLIQADKMASIGMLSSGIAHEINNPNQIIRLYAPRLQGIWESILPILEEYYRENGNFLVSGREFTEIRDQVPFHLTKILESSERIDRIVNELREYVRQDHKLEMTEVDINVIVRSAVTLVRHMINKSTDNFSLRLGKNLPLVNGVPQKLEQVLLNLIQNACQALRDKSKTIDIETTYEEKMRSVRIDVNDEGMGIPAEVLGKVTEPFYTTKKPDEGMGLGLSVSLSIIKRHKGSLDFSSEAGKGTRASVHLPAILTNPNV